MRSKIWIPLVLSAVLGLGAALVAMKALKAPHQTHVATDVGVLVAAHDIDAGTEVQPTDLTTIRYPIKDVPAEAYTDMNQAANHVAIASLIKGQLVTDRLLASKDSPAGLQALVPQGMRAVTIEVTEFSGLAGLLSPGARVDVIGTVRDERTKENCTRTILQNVRVLAVGRQLGATPSNPNGAASPPIPNNCTLLVTPKQAQALQLATLGSRPWLDLRGYNDNKTVNAGTTSLAELRGDEDDFARSLASFISPGPSAAATNASTGATTQPAQPQFAEAPAQRTVRLIMGNEEQRLSFPAEPRFEETQYGTTDLGGLK